MEGIDSLTPEWFAARLGLVTASEFHKVMTYGRDKKPFGGTARSYAMRLVAEALSSSNADDDGGFDNDAMAWGRLHEPRAIEAYQNRTFLQVEPGKFIRPWPGRRIGGTPDGFVGSDGLLEVKCPYSPAVHVRTLASGEMPLGHRDQVQGNLWLTDRKWLDFISYDPRMSSPKLRLFVVRIHRDDDYIKEKLAPMISAFEGAVCAMISEGERGLIPTWPNGITIHHHVGSFG